MIPKIVKGAVKGIGTISKIGVELTAEAVGTLSDNIKNSPKAIEKGWSNGNSNDREKFSSLGKEIGKTIKEGTNVLADKSEELAEVGVEVAKKATEYAKEKIDEAKQTKLQKDVTKFSNSKKPDQIIDVDYTEHK